jgi:hypothetical protein
MNLESTFKALRKFALVCSGANLKILNKEDCNSEESKYVMVGTLIFLTSILATLSAGYALFYGFNSVGVAGAIAVLWGAFIFTIDRFVISTLRSKQIDTGLPWHEKALLWVKQRLGLLPRLLLAGLISLIISVPLELKYFEREINTSIREDLRNQSKHDSEFELQNQPEIDELESDNEKLRQSFLNRQAVCDEIGNKLSHEAQGTGGTGKYGLGPVAKLLKEQYDRCMDDLNKLKADSDSRINTNLARINRLKSKGDTDTKNLEETRRDNIGFLKRYEALKKLAAGSNSIWWAQFFISLFILMLECTPIMMKAMANYGPYDSVLEAEEYRVNLSQRRVISDLNEKANTELFFNSRKNTAVATVQEQLMRDAMNNITNLAQAEIEMVEIDIAREIVDDLKIKLQDEFAHASRTQ